MNDNRSGRALIAQETLNILETGSYSTNNKTIALKELFKMCKAETKLYKPGSFETIPVSGSKYDTTFEVTNETTLSAGKRLCEKEDSTTVAVLNFASAKNPGGGFLGGSQAQEESLARSSGLYDSLLTQFEYYDINRDCKTTFYTEHMIYSPQVPVFRDDLNQLLENPYQLNMITSPAVNRGALVQHNSDRIDDVETVMRGRISNILKVALENGNSSLVLGAWGCGVFKNSPEVVAQLFKEALEQEFHNRFKYVIFAVLDKSNKAESYTAFHKTILSD